jgi:hypothetical protein
MQNRFVKISFSKLSNPSFIVKSRSIQSALSDPMFAAVLPSPAEVFPLIDELEHLNILTSMGNKMVKSQRDSLREEINQMMVRQVMSVNSIGANDLSFLKKSGFELNAVPTAAPVPTTPLVKKVVQGVNEGSAKVIFFGCKYASFYLLEVRDAQNRVIGDVSSTRKQADITGLPTNQILQIRVRAHNSTGKSFWSVDYPFMLVNLNGRTGLLSIADDSAA